MLLELAKHATEQVDKILVLRGYLRVSDSKSDIFQMVPIYKIPDRYRIDLIRLERFIQSGSIPYQACRTAFDIAYMHHFIYRYRHAVKLGEPLKQADFIFRIPLIFVYLIL